MNRVLFFFPIIFVFLQSFCSAAGLDGKKNELVIVYSADTIGYVEPCGCSVKKGGLARRAGMIRQIKSENPNTLILDGGDTFRAKTDYPEKRAEVVLRGMKMMGYDAINMGDGEFGLGLDFFNTQRRKWGLKFMSATIQFKEEDAQEAVKSWIIEKRGGVRIGITGIMSNVFLDEGPLQDDRISFGDPVDSLKHAMNNMQGKTDINIVMSHLGYEGTKNLLTYTPVSGIDVVIVGHGRGILKEPEIENKTLMVQCSMGGEYLGVLTLVLDDKKKIKRHDNKVIALTFTDDVPEDAEVKKIMDSFVTEKYEENGRIKGDESEEKIRKMQSELLKLSPEEFIKLMQKENEEKMKTGDQLPATVPLR
jgi:2',3'-cyclic-nucleotide 2'-phosphodiesterase (5'-nucleotidase family)